MRNLLLKYAHKYISQYRLRICLILSYITTTLATITTLAAIPGNRVTDYKKQTKVGLIYTKPESPKWLTLDIYTSGLCADKVDLFVENVRLRKAGDTSLIFIDTTLKEKDGQYSLNCQPPRTSVNLTFENVFNDSKTAIEVRPGIYNLFVNNQRWGDIVISDKGNKKISYKLIPQYSDMTKLK